MRYLYLLGLLTLAAIAYGADPIGPTAGAAGAGADPSAGLQHAEATAKQTADAISGTWKTVLLGIAGVAGTIAATVLGGQWGPLVRVGLRLLRKVSPEADRTLAQGEQALERATDGMVAVASTDAGRRVLRQIERATVAGGSLAEAIQEVTGGEASTIDGAFSWALAEYQEASGRRGRVKALRQEARDQLRAALPAPQS